MRQVVLDTETTGIGHSKGHRVIEIGCVELVDRKLTGNHYHVYLNPDRLVDEGAFRVHGISDDFLKDKSRFKDEVDQFIKFVDGAELVIHNAPFDMGFLNAELSNVGWKRSLEHHCTVLDTLVMARDKHPGQKNNLNALCKRYDIDNSNRELHGALLDAEILAFVYLAMTGGQASLFADGAGLHAREEHSGHVIANQDATIQTDGLVLAASEDEKQHHENFVTMLVEKSGVDLWS